MKENKKRGFALIYVICVVMLLSALTLAILLILSTNRISSASIDRQNKAQLAAESGIDRGISELKTKVVKDDWFKYIKIKDNELNVGFGKNELPDNIPNEQFENGAYYSVAFEEANHDNNVTGERDVKCIKITSTGKYQSITKTIAAYIEEDDISNEYFDKLFNNPLTGIKDDESDIFTFDSDINDGAAVNDSIQVISNLQGKAEAIAYKEADPSHTTLGDILDKMYNYIEGGNVSFDVSKEELEKEYIPTSLNPNYKSNLPGFKKFSLDDYISIKNASGENDFENMLQYSTMYKVIFINGDINIGQIKRPLVNYVIYCSGNIKFNSSDDVKFWNCNIYAKAITIDGKPYTLSNIEQADKDGKAQDLAYYDTNDQKVVFKSGGAALNPQPKVQIIGIGSDKAKDLILKHIMNYDDDPEPYTRLDGFWKTLNSSKSAVSVFPGGAVGKFSQDARYYINSFFVKNINEYAYGLKFKIIGWEEN
ncbi:hypothetical protein ACJDT4_17795 [Clostridium neuense]|uniref:Type 4 fimbrial biogenesis protein PilX N-terminal domain-containing protein n=1 Tax=Clostridium neuense TaxID=1728934 RepID=A0ABW8TJP7_9CLOT